MSLIAIIEAVAAIAVASAILVAAVWTLRRAGAFLPRRHRRARFARIVPLLEVGLVAVAIMAVGAVLLDTRPDAFTLLLAALAAVLVGASWFAVRDVIAGAVLRAEDPYEPGQWVRVDDVEGRIRSVGVRTIELDRDDGATVRIPYARITSAFLVRAGRSEESGSHTFALELPPELPPIRALPIIRAAARNCFFVSATREPYVHVTSGPVGHRYEVTVFTMDRTFVPEIEAAVRRRLEDVAGVDRSGTG